jgi:hypothetical protein
MNFRVWSVTFKKFLTNDEWFVNGLGELFFEDVMEGGLVKAAEGSYRIDRFTELYDIYGNQIYENDLVKLHYTHESIVSNEYLVSYRDGRWLLDGAKGLADLFLYNKKWGDTSKVVVTGNTYE